MKVSPRVLLIVIMALASPALATDFYTSSTGSDVSNNCKKITSPCDLTNGLLNEFSQVKAAHGDTIYMCAGACDGSGSAIIDMSVDTNGAYYQHVPSGTSRANAMTVMPYPGESITWRPSAVTNGLTLHDGTHYTTWKNFTLDGSLQPDRLHGHSQGVYLGSIDFATNGYHRLENMTIENWTYGGIFTTCPGNEFINNIIHDVGRAHGYYICGSSIQARASNNTLIDGGEIYNVNGLTTGINQYAVHVYSNLGAGQYTSTGVIVRNLKVHDSQNGILIMGDNIGYNNVVYNCTYRGLYAFSKGTVKFYNNTVVNCAYYAATKDSGNITEFRNNIFWGNLNDSIEIARGTVIELNNFASADPLFMDPSGKDFHLKSTSPAIGAGSNISSVFTNDNEGKKRPSSEAWDIGAYESSLLAPRNLRIPQVQ